MANLTFPEKSRLEKLLGMKTGYVLDFWNSTFREFVFDSVGKNIFDAKYNRDSGSKANRLRAFWAEEPNHLVGKLLADLLDHYVANCMTDGSEDLFTDCRKIASRLLQSGPVNDADAFWPATTDRDFSLVARAVRDAIDRNEPEQGLDRLHTFVVKFMRTLCAQRGISTDRDKPLHSLVGEYVKQLRKAGHLESEMTERILKSSISTLESFNHVRNDPSFAHDNAVLNYNESLLIFNHIASTLRFLTVLERGLAEHAAAPHSTNPTDDDIPF
jgi:hypothetical protein